MEHDELLASLLEADLYSRAERSLSVFMRESWKILEPETTFQHNWHLDCIAEHLEAVRLRQIQRLLINVQPRSWKSGLVTVTFPAWLWIRDPAMRIGAASYANNLSIKHSMDRRTIVRSDWYQRGFGHRFQLTDDQDTKAEFANDRRGVMFSTSVGGTATGKGGSLLIVDDPINPLQAASEVERTAANTWFDQTWTSRLDDKKTGQHIVVMQRLHEQDLSGHLLAKGGWTHLCLPAEAPKKTIIVFPISKREVVREEGALLHPGREGAKELATAKKDLGPGFQGQYNQDPQPAKGGFFPRSWWKRHTALPAHADETWIIVDCAAKPGVSNDYTRIGVLKVTKTLRYWKWVRGGKWGYPEMKRQVEDACLSERPDALIIEDASAGTQLLQDLAGKWPLVPMSPHGESKIVRAAAAQPSVMAGNFSLPETAPWLESEPGSGELGFLEEHEKFPNAKHDDQVDLTSMAVRYERDRGLQPKPNIMVF